VFRNVARVVDVSDEVTSVKSVRFTYSVKWTATEHAFENRLARYEAFPLRPEHLEVSGRCVLCCVVLGETGGGGARWRGEVRHYFTWHACTSHQDADVPVKHDHHPVLALHHHHNNNNPHTCTQVHWFSIINSVVTVLLLTGFLATILMRVLKSDFAKFSRDEGESSRQLQQVCSSTPRANS
jgi:hypothetical protein